MDTYYYAKSRNGSHLLQTLKTRSELIEANLDTNHYAYMGRRFLKKSTINGVLSQQHHYLYRGYLQIAALDMKTAQVPALRYIHWDPTEPIATRPLSIRRNATWYTYSHDLTKNVTELYSPDGTIDSSYDYSPYGAVSVTGSEQPIQWSSECYDPELALSYYNYRHYNPTDGRWINRDPIGEGDVFNLYGFVQNKPIWRTDYLGQKECNEDTYMHFQNLRFTIELTTALQSTIKISDPETKVLDTLDAVVGGKFVNMLAGGVGLTKELEAVKKNKLDEKIFRLLVETMSSAGGMLARIKMNISAEYCCYCCDGGEGKYRWQLTQGKYINSSLLINLKGPGGLAQASEEFIFAMTQVAEDIKNNACIES